MSVRFPPVARVRQQYEITPNIRDTALALGCGPAYVRDVISRSPQRGPARKSPPGQLTTVRLPPDVRGPLEAAARAGGTSLSMVVVRALRAYLKPPAGGVMPEPVIDPALRPGEARLVPAKPETAARPGETFEAWLARTQHRL